MYSKHTLIVNGPAVLLDNSTNFIEDVNIINTRNSNFYTEFIKTTYGSGYISELALANQCLEYIYDREQLFLLRAPLCPNDLIEKINIILTIGNTEYNIDKLIGPIPLYLLRYKLVYISLRVDINIYCSATIQFKSRIDFTNQIVVINSNRLNIQIPSINMNIVNSQTVKKLDDSEFEKKKGNTKYYDIADKCKLCSTTVIQCKKCMFYDSSYCIRHSVVIHNILNKHNDSIEPLCFKCEEDNKTSVCEKCQTEPIKKCESCHIDEKGDLCIEHNNFYKKLEDNMKSTFSDSYIKTVNYVCQCCYRAFTCDVCKLFCPSTRYEGCMLLCSMCR